MNGTSSDKQSTSSVSTDKQDTTSASTDKQDNTASTEAKEPAGDPGETESVFFGEKRDDLRYVVITINPKIRSKLRTLNS